MRFYATGLNHESAPVDVAEAFALDADAQQAFYDRLLLSDDAEVVVISTCNRTEAYLYGTDTDVQRVERALSAVADATWPNEDTFLKDDEAAIRHLLRVTSGLKSMVLGDAQILAQMKEAYQRAVDADAVHSLMHRLLHKAFRAAKRVSTETSLEQGAASVSTAAVEMARAHLEEQSPSLAISDARVLMVGAGKMGRLALNALASDAPQHLAVTNRSPEKAEAVADTHDGRVVPWNDRHAAVAQADLVMVATGAPEPTVQNGALPAGETSETLLVDIARPRNVDPAIDDRSSFTVYNLDDLHDWTAAVREQRSEAVPAAEAICEEVLSDFVTWVFHQQALQPAIQAIRETFDTIREQEVERHAHRTDMDREEVEHLTKSIMQKLLAVPIVRLKNVDPDSVDFVQGIELLHALFSPSDEGGRSLPEATDQDQPSLADAPSRCPYLTHGNDDAAESHRLRDALQVPAQHHGAAEGSGAPAHE